MSWTIGGAVYARRKKLTFNANAYIAANLVDFPAVVHFDAGETDFWTGNPPVAGGGVRFADSTGAALSFEVESYDTVGDDAYWHVRIPLLSATVNTIIYLYYDVSVETDGADKGGVWDASYEAVYHLNQDRPTLGAYDDATANNHDATNHGSTNRANMVDNGRDLDGLADYITIPDHVNLDGFANGHTVEAVITPDAISGSQAICNKRAGNMPFDLMLSASTVQFYLWGTAVKYAYSAVGTIAIGTKYHVAGTYDGSNLRVYIDGVLRGTTPTSQSVPTNSSNVHLGRRADGPYDYFNGGIDEVAISTVARSADWLLARASGPSGTWLTIGPADNGAIIGRLARYHNLNGLGGMGQQNFNNLN